MPGGVGGRRLLPPPTRLEIWFLNWISAVGTEFYVVPTALNFVKMIKSINISSRWDLKTLNLTHMPDGAFRSGLNSRIILTF